MSQAVTCAEWCRDWRRRNRPAGRGPVRRRGHAGFTLLELLAVMAIVGLLMGMLFTVMAQMRTQARRSRAASEAVQIATAWDGYLGDYHRLPFASGVMRGDPVRVLGGQTGANNDNPRRIVYLDVSRELEDDPPELLDPWGEPYRFRLNADGWVSDPRDGGERLGLHVLVWSIGPDGENGTDDDIFSAN